VFCCTLMICVAGSCSSIIILFSSCYCCHSKPALVVMVVCIFQAANKKQKYERISEKKMSTPVEVLCKVNMQDTS